MNSATKKMKQTIAMTALLVAACCSPALGQATPPVIFVDVENIVFYNNNITDQPKLVPNGDITPAAPADLQGVFGFSILIGDVVAVNGQSAKGTLVFRSQNLNLRPADFPRAAGAPIIEPIADTDRGALQTMTLEILKSDGAPVGIFTLIGMGGPAPPGAPLSITSFNYAIVGGTGAFLGARGQAGHAGAASGRQASMAENPANRRVNGGGRRRYALQVIPNSLPQIVATGSGPAVYHADFSQVTTARPAKAGEVLIVQATGLGATLPRSEPGQAFPLDAAREVNSPIEVSVNGKPAEVMNKLGWPGLVDTYRIDFRVPDGTGAGPAGVQLTAAWIPGTLVNIPMQ